MEEEAASIALQERSSRNSSKTGGKPMEKKDSAENTFLIRPFLHANRYLIDKIEGALAHPGRSAAGDPRARFDFTGPFKEMTENGPQPKPRNQNEPEKDYVLCALIASLFPLMYMPCGRIPQMIYWERNDPSQPNKWTRITGTRTRQKWKVGIAYNTFRFWYERGSSSFSSHEALAHWGVYICPAGVENQCEKPYKIFGLNFDENRRHTLILEEIWGTEAGWLRALDSKDFRRIESPQEITLIFSLEEFVLQAQLFLQVITTVAKADYDLLFRNCQHFASWYLEYLVACGWDQESRSDEKFCLSGSLVDGTIEAVLRQENLISLSRRRARKRFSSLITLDFFIQQMAEFLILSALRILLVLPIVPFLLSALVTYFQNTSRLFGHLTSQGLKDDCSPESIYHVAYDWIDRHFRYHHHSLLFIVIIVLDDLEPFYYYLVISGLFFWLRQFGSFCCSYKAFKGQASTRLVSKPQRVLPIGSLENQVVITGFLILWVVVVLLRGYLFLVVIANSFSAALNTMLFWITVFLAVMDDFFSVTLNALRS